jgi:anti-sigma B factor antagonist
MSAAGSQERGVRASLLMLSASPAGAWTCRELFGIISPAFMQLTTTDDGHVTILTVDGDLVIGESESLFKRTVTRLLEEGKVNLLVDMRKVNFLDSSGLGALVRAMTMSQKEGGQTKLLGAGPQVRKLLEMTRLDSVFENFTDMETAVSSF